MSKDICRCDKCSGHRVTDPVTGLLVHGRIVGRKELLEHGRLARIKQSLNNTTITTDDSDASFQLGSYSQSYSTRTEFEQESGTVPSVRGSAQHQPEVDQDPIQEMQSQFSRRQMAYFRLPSKGMVFASTPTSNMSIAQVSLADLTLSTDASINQGLIEYEAWLENAISTLRGPLKISKGPQSHAQNNLIQEITLATEDVHAAKKEEWLRQLAAIHTHNPLPPFVIANQCAVVDGGKFLYGRHLQSDPIVLCCYLGLAICHLVMNISIVRCEFLATVFRVLLNLCLAQTLQPPELESLIASISLDVRTIFDTLKLHPHTQSFVCCPECYKLYHDSQVCPDLCTHQSSPDAEVCDAPLYTRRAIRGGTRRYPTRTFLYHDMKAWLANMLSRQDIEAHADRDVFADSCDMATELRDIWDGKVFREFKGPDGKLFIQPGSREGRYIFSLCMDGFNPFIMKEAGKKVSVGAIYMVLLNLPVDIRYRVENMFLVGIIPGPREPSLEQINHVLAPLVDDLLRFWEPGVFIKQTAHYCAGRLCRAVLIPLVCDLPAARQMSGSASHASTHFCSFCKLPLHEIDNLEVKSWPIRTWEEHRQSACNWKNVTSTAARLRLYRQNGVRWSELLRLPYWDPTTFTVLDCMHSLLLGDLRRHCRYIWGMDFQLEDDDFHVKPDGKGYSVTEGDVRDGHSVLEHGADKEVAALPFNVLRRICQDTQAIRFDRKRKNQLVEALLQYRAKLGWPSSSVVHNAANDSVLTPTSRMATSTSIPKPRRNELATGTELQDGRIKYSSAKSLSKIQGFRKGLIVALLLDLDTPPSPGNLDGLWALNKPTLAGILWDLHQKGARPRIGASSHPTSIPEIHGHTTVRDSSRNFAEPHFGSSVHGSDMLREEMAGDDSESMNFASTVTTDISAVTDDCNPTNKCLAENLGDSLPLGSQKKPSRKERVVLGQQTLAEVWDDMSKTTLPSWIGRAPPKLGDGRHGKLSADQWRTACTVNLIITLVRLWGSKPPNDRQYQMLVNFMDLVTACKLAMMRKTTPERVDLFQHHMRRYLETTKTLYVYSALTPNHHLSLHLPRLFENFGPPHAWACFVFERCLRWLKFIKTSSKFGELEQTLLTRFCMSQHIRILMQTANLPPILSHLQRAFSKALESDARGTFWNDLWAFAPEEQFTVHFKSKEAPLPVWIREKLTKGFLGGITAKRYPSVCSTLESLTYRGMQFSITSNSLGNSYVVFNRQSGNDQPWSAGSIEMIFHLLIEETMHGPFFVIKPYLPLNIADAQFDPYRKFLSAAGQLVYEERGDLLVCTIDEVMCHFAHTPYKSPNIPKQCIHVLPLDRE